MSAYGRGPNVSQYIANLNAIPQSGPQHQPDPLAFDEDLALFSTSDLFDFDLGNVKHDDYARHADGVANKAKAGKPTDVDYANAATYMFDPAQPMLNTNFPPQNFDPQLFQSPQSATFPQHQQHQQQVASPTSPTDGTPHGHKRSLSVSSPSGSTEDPGRHAAEEDKRRRNTAASARFRVKKKQREAALEKAAKENADRVDNLQKRVDQLETENKWLRELIVQKGGSADSSGTFTGSDAVPATIVNNQTKKGVGTDASN